MAYIKNTWVDQEVERPKTYEMVNNSDGSVTLVDSFGLVSELGTPVNADNMNHIEDGIGEHENRIAVLENLPDKYLNKSQITNCLLEVPQNIKLELNNGTLTLKAGSKVIVPNGFEADGTTPKFDEVVVANDLSVGASSLSTAERGIVLLNGGIVLIHWASNKSGTSPTTQGFYYHTGENKFYRDGVAQTNFSFPIMMGDYTTQYGFNNIKYVFNGMGNFGSTLWVDKGVKGLIPNGRNEDGSLRNFEYTTNTVAISDRSVLDGENRAFLLNYKKNVLEDKAYSEDNQTIAGTGQYVYNPITNHIYNSSGTKGLWVLCGLYTSVNGRITSFQPQLPFRAVDYNDYTKDLDTKVNKAGDTMTGGLNIDTLENDTAIRLIHSDIIQGSNPSAQKYTSIVFADKDLKDLGAVYYSALTNDERYVALRCGNKAGNATQYLVLGYDSSNRAKFSFPKCTTKATTTSSARSDLVAVVTQNYVNGTSWYRVWSDGWIEQGGANLQSTDGDYRNITVTLLKNFSNTNYNVQVTSSWVDDTGSGTNYFSSKQTNGFTMSVTGYGGNWYACGY